MMILNCLLRRMVLLASLLSLLLGACRPAPETPVATQAPNQTGMTPAPDLFEVAASSVTREGGPQVGTGELDTLVAGNTAFGMDLYQAVRDETANLFYSPFSISIALAMTFAGARGETERQMAETLRFNLPQDRLHPAFNTLDQALASRGQRSGEQLEGGFQLHIANSIWGQRGYTFRQEFIDMLAAHYGAGLRLVDFVTAAEAARQVINTWIADQTEQKIKDLIPEGVLNELTRLVLANAIYFNAAWKVPFDPDLTHPGVFRLLDGQDQQVDLMTHSRPVQLRYGSEPGYQALELPYQGDELGMLILVPDIGEFDTFERSLDHGQLEQILAGLTPKTVALEMPKFGFETSLGLTDILAQMGMPAAFDPTRADFMGIDGTDQLYIGAVLHKSFVAVDERGTEAAAATVVVVQVESLPETEVQLTIDRPFLFLIRDFQTGSVLFMGRLLDPGA